jgi:V/A-type H+-transporting ATPase subunit D
VSRVPANKATLAQQQRLLETYREFLPSLDLKRRQLLARRAEERRALEAVERRRSAFASELGPRLPMLANASIDLDGLVVLEAVDRSEENLLGVRLPVLGVVTLRTAPYARLGRPHWVDAVAAALEERIRLDLECDVRRERVRRLSEALAELTQRVNLFEKVLIPRALATIRRVELTLADAARFATVRAKIAKAKAAREPAAP